MLTLKESQATWSFRPGKVPNWPLTTRNSLLIMIDNDNQRKITVLVIRCRRIFLCFFFDVDPLQRICRQLIKECRLAIQEILYYIYICVPVFWSVGGGRGKVGVVKWSGGENGRQRHVKMARRGGGVWRKREQEEGRLRESDEIFIDNLSRFSPLAALLQSINGFLQWFQHGQG